MFPMVCNSPSVQTFLDHTAFVGRRLAVTLTPWMPPWPGQQYLERSSNMTDPSPFWPHQQHAIRSAGATSDRRLGVLDMSTSAEKTAIHSQIAGRFQRGNPDRAWSSCVTLRTPVD
jgi:hypothetical protein